MNFLSNNESLQGLDKTSNEATIAAKVRSEFKRLTANLILQELLKAMELGKHFLKHHQIKIVQKKLE